MSVSVIIPTFNEQRRIGVTVQRLIKLFEDRKFSYEIIVSDGGSTDKTLEVLPKTQHLKIIKSNKRVGKGESLLVGMRRANGDKILLLDADFPVTDNDVLRIIGKTKDDTLTIAVRHHPLNYPMLRRFLSRSYNLLVKIMFRLKVCDTQVGVKCLPKNLAKKLANEIESKNYAFDVELILRALQHKCKILEVPVCWKHNAESKIKIPTTIFNMFFDTLRLLKLKITE